MTQRILLVEPNTTARDRFAAILARVSADVQACADFLLARRAVEATAFDLLVTQLRLGAYNGVHLVYLARPHGMRCLVYAAVTDPVLAREVQSLGAFYERMDCLPLVLVNYVMHTLPPADRRDPERADRRGVRRGGRRVVDGAGMPATSV
jgi:DNA-binding NtrC family response regulator